MWQLRQFSLSGRELLFSVTAKDCEWDYFRKGGKGGQKVNKTSSCVRCRHTASGAIGVSTEARGQRQNKVAAFRKMNETKEFQSWLKIEFARKSSGKKPVDIERLVDEAMHEVNIFTEVKDEKGKWVPEDGQA